jgi:hypothetical protein
MQEMEELSRQCLTSSSYTTERQLKSTNLGSPVACYTRLGAVGCAYMFYVSTLPVTIPDDWGAQVPGVIGAITTVASSRRMIKAFRRMA